MAYHIYQTEGFVLGRRNNGEAHAMVTLFTEELGLVWVHAQSIREEHSKLRYGIETFSRGHFSLVRGKDVWRLTGSQELESPYHILRHDRKRFGILVRVARLLVHLLYGEERNSELYTLFQKSVTFLEKADTLTESELDAFERLTVLRIFALLGYVGGDTVVKKYLESQEFSDELCRQTESEKVHIISVVNEALAQSRT